MSEPIHEKPVIDSNDPCALFVGRLILRPAKITPSGFQWLDPALSDSKDKDKIVIRAKSGRDRGYFANGFVALSTSEDAHGLVIITDRAGWRDDWGCLELTYTASNFAKALVSPVQKEEVEEYYKWVYANQSNMNITFDLWRANKSLRGSEGSPRLD